MLAGGCLLVVIAVGRLDTIYAGDPGVFRAGQLAPRPIAFAYTNVVPATDALRDVFAGSGFGRSVCADLPLGGLCERRPALRDDETRKAALERYARGAFGRGAGDVSVTSWQTRPNNVVTVAVARFPDEPAARAALRVSRRATGAASRPGRSGTRSAQTAWLEGTRVLVGVVVSAPSRPAAESQLRKTTRQVEGYVALARVTWYEALAVGPLMLVLSVVLLARGLFSFLAALVALLVALPALVFALALAPVLLLYLPVALFLRRRRRRRRAAVPAAFVLRETGPPASPPPFRIESLESAMGQLRKRDESVVLTLVGLVAFAIAALTPSLFPASLVWGSLLLVALYAPAAVASRRGARSLSIVRKAVVAGLALTAAAVLWGAAPIALLSDPLFQIPVVVAGLLVLVSRWRGLITETAVGYARWYEDVDARSSLFLAGAALLTLASGALFLASTGDANPWSQGAEKLLGLGGFFVASTAAAYVRASRDSAARERARSRATPHVLYLRSFDDDKLRVPSPRVERRGLERLGWRRTELLEDVIARALSAVGPVVAIARPGTGQRELGAARDAIVVEDWLAAVRMYMLNAKLVAVVMGTSEGLGRELETLGELGLLDRVCIFVPPLSVDELDARIDALRRSPGFAALWGKIPTEAQERLVALTSVGGERVVFVAPKRTAPAYRAATAQLAPK